MTMPVKVIYQKRGYPRIDAKSQRRLEKLRERSFALTAKLIEEGLGHVRYSELREHLDNEHVVELLAVDAEIFDIRTQYERETGVLACFGLR